MLVAATAFAMNVSAQEKGDMAAGGSVVMGSGDGINNFGIGAKFQYNVTKPVRLEGSFTYFLPKDRGIISIKTSLSMWDLSVTGHYLFDMDEKFVLYPLAGIGILGCISSMESDLDEYNYSDSSTEFGVNLGGGIDFKLSETLILNGQIKYFLVSDWNRLIISAGVVYRF